MPQALSRPTPASTYPATRLTNPLRILAAAFLLLSALAFLITTLHWPLTGDAVLMRYASFLAQHGFVPYRTVQDLNLPGSYLPHWLILHLFGPSNLAWRLYDYALLALIAFSLVTITRPYSRFAGLWASCLIVLIHARDDIEQAGQRDFEAAALLIAGTAALLSARRSHRLAPALLFGLAAGTALTLKPTLILFLLLPALNNLFSPAELRLNLKQFLAAALGCALPLLGCLVWLMHWHSVRAFAYSLFVLGPYHTRLGHIPLRALLYSGFSPMLPLVLAALAAALLLRHRASALPSSFAAVRNLLLCGAAAGWIAVLLQRRGYTYHRYPLLVFLLPVVTMQLDAALDQPGLLQWLSATMLLWSSLLFAPLSAWKAAHYHSAEEAFAAQLRLDLLSLDSRPNIGPLSGRVQCIDSISGCLDTLNHLQWVQSTGQIYDEFLFHAPDSRAVRDSRAAFLSQLQASVPLVVVVTDPLFPSGPNHFAKLDQWPGFRTWLDAHYTLTLEHNFTQGLPSMGRPIVPASYRIYVLKQPTS